jgi:hypothetical protein
MRHRNREVKETSRLNRSRQDKARAELIHVDQSRLFSPFEFVAFFTDHPNGKFQRQTQTSPGQGSLEFQI